MMKSEWLCVNCTNVLENIDDRKSLCIYNLMHLRLKHEWYERKANIKDVKKTREFPSGCNKNVYRNANFTTCCKMLARVNTK